MNFIQIIEKIESIIKDPLIKEALLSKNLSFIPPCGAEEWQIKEEEEKLSRSFTDQHKTLLKHWNGIRLDIINFYGCGKDYHDIDQLSEWQLARYGITPQDFSLSGTVIAMADSPFGCVYLEDDKGIIHEYDAEVGEVAEVASDLSSLISDYIFGERAAEFAGDEWKQELIDAGIITPSR